VIVNVVLSINHAGTFNVNDAVLVSQTAKVQKFTSYWPQPSGVAEGDRFDTVGYVGTQFIIICGKLTTTFQFDNESASEFLYSIV
jgi:hypothetical protein